MIIIDPTITWIPWNPVAIKNDDPKDESWNVNVDILYSIACVAVKYIPNINVIIKYNDGFLFFNIIM